MIQDVELVGNIDPSGIFVSLPLSPWSRIRSNEKRITKTKTIQVNLPTKPSTKYKQSKPFMLTKWINSLDDGCFASQLGLLLANGTMPVRPHWAPLHHVNQRHRHHDPATHDRLQHLPNVQLRSMVWCPAAGSRYTPNRLMEVWFRSFSFLNGVIL